MACIAPFRIFFEICLTRASLNMFFQSTTFIRVPVYVYSTKIDTLPYFIKWQYIHRCNPYHVPPSFNFGCMNILYRSQIPTFIKPCQILKTRCQKDSLKFVWLVTLKLAKPPLPVDMLQTILASSLQQWEWNFILREQSCQDRGISRLR